VTLKFLDELEQITQTFYNYTIAEVRKYFNECSVLEEIPQWRFFPILQDAIAALKI